MFRRENGQKGASVSFSTIDSLHYHGGTTMDIQVLGAWGEFLGGVASLVAAVGVIGSLVFVGLQVKQNTGATQATTRQAVYDSYVTQMSIGVDNPTVAKAFAALNQGAKESELDPLARTQLGLYALIYWRTMENTFYQYSTGLLEQAEWLAYRNAIRGRIDPNVNFSQEFILDVWESFHFAFSDRFVAEVETIRQELGKAS